VFSRAAHAVVRDCLGRLAERIDMVGEEYLTPGATPAQFQATAAAVQQAGAELILNTLDGTASESFFAALSQRGVAPEQVPSLSFRLTENDLHLFGASAVRVGDCAVAGYFQTVDRPSNTLFVERFRRQYGPNRVLSDPMEAAYCGVHLWAQAAARAGDAGPASVRAALPGLQLVAPGADVTVAADLHLGKIIRVGRINAQAQLDVVLELSP
jgi:urea transport system substrate-binding protein